MFPKHKTIFLQSSQASEVDLSLGRARWILQQPILFQEAQIACHEFTYTNYFINVSASIGNNMFYYSDDANASMKYSATIPDGCYTISSYNDILVTNQQARLGKIVFQVLPNVSSGKAYILFNTETGYYVHFAKKSTLLGFDIGDYPANKSNVAYAYEVAQSVARFNNVEQIQVTCNLTNDSISNTQRSSVIHTVTPTVGTGYTESSKHYNLLWMNAPMLANSTSEITISLSDQSGAPLFLTENFSVTLLVKYV